MTIFRSAACAATLLAGATLIVSPLAAATWTVPITVPLSARPAQPPAWNSATDIYHVVDGRMAVPLAPPGWV